MIKLPRYMTSGLEVHEFEDDQRKILYPSGLRESWKGAEVAIEKTRDDIVLMINGHEVMASYQYPYMKRLAEIVVRDGGNILNIGHGLGIVDSLIEEAREKNKVEDHYIIELNEQVAQMADRQHPNCHIINKSWEDCIHELPKDYFDGVLYDGYPLDITQIHRDGIIFLEKLMSSGILKKGATTTFFVDAVTEISDEFKKFLLDLGFTEMEFEKINIQPPSRKRQHWHAGHFIAPILRF